MMDLSALPDQSKVQSLGADAPAPENPQPITWNTITAEQKAVHLQSLIVSCVDNIYRNNPVLWLWVPVGSKEEVTRDWITIMTRQLGGVIDPSKETVQLYFPDVKEEASVSVPMLHTQDVQVVNDLLKFTQELASLAEVDISAIHAQIGLDASSMKGLLLFWRIGMPAMMKRLEQQQQEKAGPKVSKGGILLSH